MEKDSAASEAFPSKFQKFKSVRADSLRGPSFDARKGRFDASGPGKL